MYFDFKHLLHNGICELSEYRKIAWEIVIT